MKKCFDNRSDGFMFKEFVEQVWLKEKEEGGNEATIRFHKNMANKLSGYFENIKLHEIAFEDVESCMDYFRNEYISRNGKSLSSATVNNLRSTLKGIFEFAREKKYIKYNPVISKNCSRVFPNLGQNKTQYT